MTASGLPRTLPEGWTDETVVDEERGVTYPTYRRRLTFGHITVHHQPSDLVGDYWRVDLWHAHQSGILAADLQSTTARQAMAEGERMARRHSMLPKETA